MDTDKPIIPYKLKNNMELNKIKRKKYFTKALLELGAQLFSEEEVRSCVNITYVADKLIVWDKELHTYIEGDAAHI